MEEDADTGTPIIVTKLPGSALFIQLCFCWTEESCCCEEGAINL